MVVFSRVLVYTNYHHSLQVSPFKALYGYLPPMLPVGHVTNDEARSWLNNRATMIASVKQNLLQTQNRMKQQVDKKRLERVLK